MALVSLKMQLEKLFCFSKGIFASVKICPMTISPLDRKQPQDYIFPEIKSAELVYVTTPQSHLHSHMLFLLLLVV